ncbi:MULTISPECIES: hypothetical protein [Gemella]|uniref:hypothetical protein n=1 Tax=Gemella TaxID=1378 RepID=UPI000767F210|nr:MULTISPECIES: hypothetical protein [Gemella]AME09097.1 hypothetical protein AXE85_02435 [Gemella sp. oral taxon 928]AXI26669.1 hypothetical protein CG018_04210 [Gemella sp. ND 6198]
MNDYQRIINYDFNDVVLDNKLVVKFKMKKTFSEWDFISLFSHKRGERFIIKTPDSRSSKIGIGYEKTWLLDSNDFLSSFDNKNILSGFEELKTQVTFIDIHEHDEEYFGLYGGVSDGSNKSTQEWVDFSDTSFVVPEILAVFKGDFVYFTLFFDMEDGVDFLELWRKRTEFLEKLVFQEEPLLNEPKISVVRDIYPEVWQENIRKALLKIEQGELKRLVLPRKNQILLENRTSLAAITKYLLNKKRYFIAFEMKKSLFVTTNPLVSLDVDDEELKAYLYLKQENLFSDKSVVMFDEKDIFIRYKEEFKAKFEKDFEVSDDKMLMGKKLDVYAVLKTRIISKQKAIKALSVLYPIPLLKGYPEVAAEEFLKENCPTGYGFWYSPFGYINANLDARFYTCGNTMIALENMITLFTSILLSKDDSYDEVIERTNSIVSSRLKLFNH